MGSKGILISFQPFQNFISSDVGIGRFLKEQHADAEASEAGAAELLRLRDLPAPLR